MLQFTEETAPHQVSLEAYGTSLRVCTNTPDLLSQLEALLPPGWRACDPTPEQEALGILLEADDSYSVYRGATRVSEGHNLRLSLIMLDGQIRGYVAVTSPDKTFVHAGAIAHRGRAIVFPGHSFSGKTTLTAALVRAGAEYCSDEFAVLGPDGLVYPYPKPLSLREDPANGQVETRVEELGGTATAEPLPLGLLVITSYRPGAKWRPKPLSPGTAALAMLSNTVTARTRPEVAMQTIKRALEGAVAVESERGEAAELAKELLNGVPE
jgi:hypothetical protein